MLKTILCIIDFTESSSHTLTCAASMARDLHAHLTILYTYRLMHVNNDEVFQRRREIEQEAIQNFAVLEKAILKDAIIPYDFKTEVGFLAYRVEAYAKKSQICFVVIDKNMRLGSREAFDELVENIQAPLVIVS